MGATHQCPAPGCTRWVPDHLLMCRPHWLQVPADIRGRVWHTYKRAPLSEAHLAAIGEAIRSLTAPAPDA